MSEPFYVARAQVNKVAGVHRRAELEIGTQVDFGVHGSIKRHYKLESAPDLPLPVDYIAAAVGTWMLGTLNGALEVRQVSLPPEAISATVEGINELVDGIPTLTDLRVHYRLRIPSGSREVVERALARHQEKCPSARSMQGSVRVHWTADIDEENG